MLMGHAQRFAEESALWHSKLCLCDDKLSVLGKRYLYVSAGESRARAIIASFAFALVPGSLAVRSWWSKISITVEKAL